MKDSTAIILAVLFVVLVFGGTAWFAVSQWNECRDMGFSVFYCIKHVM